MLLKIKTKNIEEQNIEIKCKKNINFEVKENRKKI